MIHKAEPSSNEQDHFHRSVNICEEVNTHAACASVTGYRRARRSERKASGGTSCLVIVALSSTRTGWGDCLEISYSLS